MSKKRAHLKRRIDQSKAAIHKSADYLLDMRSEYDPDYPEYVQTLDHLLAIHVRLIELEEEFRKHI